MFAVFAVFVLAVVGGLIYFFREEPTCFDNKRNQNEEGVDCGGVCFPCADHIKDATILWSRFFRVREDTYDVAALLENNNSFFRTDKLVYAIKLYDRENVLIAIRENNTFTNPGEKFVIFEPNLVLQNRVPVRSSVEIRSAQWTKAESVPLKIDVLEKRLLLEDFPSRIEVKIKNQSTDKIYSNIEATILLLSASGDVLGGSRTIVDKLEMQNTSDLIFVWPQIIKGAAGAEVFLREMP